MKKILYSFALLVFLTSSFSSYAGDKPKKMLKLFAQRVESCDLNGTLALLDGSYKQVQLIGSLRNDTTQFISELFCGKTSDDKFMCAKFNEIANCSFLKLGEFANQENNVYYAPIIFKVETVGGDNIFVDMTVVKIVTKTGTLFRLAGAVG